MDQASAGQPELSVVVPAYNEAANLPDLFDEFRAAVIDAGVDAELIVVDDGSTDDTAAVMAAAREARPWLRGLRLPRNSGQSAAWAAGIAAARGVYVGMLDADGQNDPADLVPMLETLRRDEADLVQGRRANRQDTRKKKVASAFGRAARRVALRDRVYDTGCSCRVARAPLARTWPLHLRGIHRFLPALSAMRGARIVEVDVHHRPRRHGQTKYRDLLRGVPGFFDLLAVRWMQRRHIQPPEQDQA